MQLQLGSGRSNCAGMSRRTALKVGFLGVTGLSLGDLLKLRADGAATKPVILEVRETDEVGEGVDLLARVPSGLLRPIEPERRAGLRGEVPLDDFANVGVELLGGALDRIGGD